MKFFSTLSLLVAVLLIAAGSGVSAQVRQSPPSTAPPQGDKTKLLRNQRDSGAPRDTENTSGVAARRKANSAPMAPDTSYNTIVNAPPSSSRTSATQARPNNSEPSAIQAPTGTNMPESMRIQRDTVRDLPPRRDLITPGGTSAPPGVVNSSVERNRADSSAPSRQRLQIDDLSAVRPQQPNANSMITPPIDPTVRGTANGSGSGMSGQGMSGPSVNSAAPRSLAPSSRTSSGSHSSGGSSSSGGSH